MWKIAKTHWVWTELAESLHPDRKAGEPIWEHYRQTCPKLWVEKGYMREAEADGADRSEI